MKDRNSKVAAESASSSTHRCVDSLRSTRVASFVTSRSAHSFPTRVAADVGVLHSIDENNRHDPRAATTTTTVQSKNANDPSLCSKCTDHRRGHPQGGHPRRHKPRRSGCQRHRSELSREESF